MVKPELDVVAALLQLGPLGGELRDAKRPALLGVRVHLVHVVWHLIERIDFLADQWAALEPLTVRYGNAEEIAFAVPFEGVEELWLDLASVLVGRDHAHPVLTEDRYHFRHHGRGYRLNKREEDVEALAAYSPHTGGVELR